MENNEGFTLIEAMLGATILFIGIAMVMSTLSACFTRNIVTDEQKNVIEAISSEEERLKTTPYDTDPPTGGPGTLIYEFGGAISTDRNNPSIYYFTVPNLPAHNGVQSNPQPAPPGGWNPVHFKGGVVPNPPFAPAREPALGTIEAVDISGTLIPPGNTGDVIQFTIKVEFMSDVVGYDSEEFTILVSPTY